MPKRSMPTFTGETLYEDGRPIGCCVVDGLDLLGPLWKEPRVAVARTYRRIHGTLQVETVPLDGEGRLTRNVGPYEPVEALLALAFAGKGMPAHASPAFDRTLRLNCANAARSRLPGTGADALLATARADLAAAAEACAPFLDTLDPTALRHGLKHTFPSLTAHTYASLDRSFGSPLLATATEWFPNLGGLLRRLLDSDRAEGRELAAAIPEGRAATRAVLARTLDGWERLTGRDPHGAGEATLRVAEALDALADDAVAGVAARIEGAAGALADDPAGVLAMWLRPLSREWWPTSRREWELVAECAMPLALSSEGAHVPPASFLPLHPDPAAYLGVDGDWQALAHLREDATKAGRGPGETDVSKALEDLAGSFGRRLVGPAVARFRKVAGDGPVPPGGLPDLTRASMLLRTGLTFADEVRLARLWVARRGDVDRGVAALSLEAQHSTWPKALPDKRRGAFEVVVLGSVRELLDEGMWGVDDGGMAGLDHAVGMRLGPILSGRERIVSVRSRTAAGTTRLATARVGLGRRGPFLIEGLGRSGKPMPPEARRQVLAYVESLASDPSTDDRRASAAVLPAGDPVVASGYDTAAPGAWRAVLDMWDELLPPELQDLTMEELAAMALAVDARMPVPDGPAAVYEVFDLGDGADPADVEAILARMTEAGAPGS